MESEKQDLEMVNESQIITAIQRLWDKRKFGGKEYFVLTISILLIADLAILLNIPFLRQIFGFLFLTVLPGLFILQVLKLNKIGSTEKFILVWGISISFLLFFGLLINNLLFGLDYEKPLATIPLLIAFNIAFIVLAIVGHKINKTQTFSPPNLNLTAPEKAFLIVPILFPALSIFGMLVMNMTDNNIVLMFLLFLIPIYVIFVCFFNHKFSKRLYPVVIFLIGISLLLLMSLRSNHIIGTDTHVEYYLFQTTLEDLHWSASGYGNQLDACLSISLLPAMYQSILNISSEFLFKILYSLLYSIVPLVVYVLSKKYIGELYGFLASCFFMFQPNFLFTTANSRTCIAILFFALAMMTLFNDRIDPLKKRILFIVFMASCMVSHYSTTYIFFFIILGTFVGMEMVSKKYEFKKVVSLTIAILFFSMIFFWYSQVTEIAFNAGVAFVDKTFRNLNEFFIIESRTEAFKPLIGQEFTYPILSRVSLAFTLCTFIFIGIGVLIMLKRYKEMVVISNVNLKKPDFLKIKFEMEYLVMVLICAGLLVIMIALPFVSVGYDIWRLYSLVIVILSICFVIGGIILSKNLSFLKKALPKKPIFRKKLFTKRSHYLGDNEKNGSQIRAYLIILLILIPYFMFGSNAMHQIFGDTSSIILNSEGKRYDMDYVHDQESYGAKWLKEYGEGETKIYTDGRQRYLMSQGKIPKNLLRSFPFIEPKKVEGYICLRYYNVVNGKLAGPGWHPYNITEYSDIFGEMSKVYANGGSEVWKN